MPLPRRLALCLFFLRVFACLPHPFAGVISALPNGLGIRVVSRTRVLNFKERSCPVEVCVLRRHVSLGDRGTLNPFRILPQASSVEDSPSSRPAGVLAIIAWQVLSMLGFFYLFTNEIHACDSYCVTGPLLGYLAGLFLILGTSCALVAIGLWARFSWSRIGSAITTVAFLPFGPFLAVRFLGEDLFLFAALPILVVTLVIVWYLQRPRVGRYLSK